MFSTVFNVPLDAKSIYYFEGGFMHIGVVGTGYVGLVTGACFAEFGLFVTCVDKDEKKIRSLKKGVVPFYEPGLEDLVSKNVKQGRLKFTSKLSKAVDTSTVIFIAVGTPPRGDGSADLSYVKAVGAELASHMDCYKVIATKSTVPVGTGDMLKKIISKNLASEIDFDVASNPEFLREGSAIEDFMRPNRIVIGSETEKAGEIIKSLYKPLYLIETPFVLTDVRTAELIKYASNSFLATKISFINEIANLCERLGVDVHMVARGMGLDRRIGSKFLHPGPGFGGSCFPKDLKALVNIAEKNGIEPKILKAAIDVNKRQPLLETEKIRESMGGLKGKNIAVLGLSFKPNTDDMREAPSIYIIKALLKEGASIRAYDPAAMKNAKSELPDIAYAKSAYSTVKGADALVILTEWNEFRNLDLERIKRLMAGDFFFDLRNIYEPGDVRQQGFKYFSRGRGKQG